MSVPLFPQSHRWGHRYVQSFRCPCKMSSGNKTKANADTLSKKCKYGIRQDNEAFFFQNRSAPGSESKTSENYSGILESLRHLWDAHCTKRGVSEDSRLHHQPLGLTTSHTGLQSRVFPPHYTIFRAWARSPAFLRLSHRPVKAVILGSQICCTLRANLPEWGAGLNGKSSAALQDGKWINKG